MNNFDFQLRLFREPKFPEAVPVMTVSERETFVEGLMNGWIFTSMHIHEIDKKKDDLGKVFLVQGEGQFMLANATFLSDVGAIWEFHRDREVTKFHKGSVSAAMYPVFQTARVVSNEDWRWACRVVAERQGQPGHSLPTEKGPLII